MKLRNYWEGDATEKLKLKTKCVLKQGLLFCNPTDLQIVFRLSLLEVGRGGQRRNFVDLHRR